MGSNTGQEVEFGGALYGRTSDPRHHELVQDILLELHENGFLIQETMEQFCSIADDGGIKFLPDRYVQGSARLVQRKVQGETNAMYVAPHMRPMS